MERDDEVGDVHIAVGRVINSETILAFAEIDSGVQDAQSCEMQPNNQTVRNKLPC